MRDGHYTRTLNELGREGWELVTVAPDVHDTPAAPERSGGLPMPRALGRLEDAAAMVSRLDPDDAPPAPAPGGTVTTLLWVLRRPLDDA